MTTRPLAEFHAWHLPRCSWTGCDKPATQLIRNRRNEPIGQYCDRHTTARLAELNR